MSYSLRHRPTGTPMINIQSTLLTAPDLCKNVSQQCYLVAAVIHIQSVCHQIVHIYTHILRNIEMLVEQRNNNLGQQ